MNVVTALEKESIKQRKAIEKEIDPITETNRLLAERTAGDREVIRALGIKDVEYIQKQKITGKKIELLEKAKKHKNVYTLEEIKAIALKYRLRFLNTQHYAGKIDSEMVVKINQFAEEDGIKLNSAHYQYSFFVLAPETAFNLEEKPKPAPIDPILFYKLDNEHYRLVHQWGGDLTMLRAIYGRIMKNKGNMLTFIFSIGVILLFLAAIVDSKWMMVPVVIMFLLFGFMAAPDPESNFYSEDNWDSQHKSSL